MIAIVFTSQSFKKRVGFYIFVETNRYYMTIEVVRYDESRKEQWDAFVRVSRNGTFLFERNYMDYHCDRFVDCSLMIFNDGNLCALFPATFHEDRLSVVSHGGLTYGSFIVDVTVTSALMLQVFSLVFEYYRKETVAKKIIYKTIPYIYHQYPAEEDLYALFRCNATLVERKISSTIKLSEPLPFKGRRKLTAAMKSRLRIVEDDNFAAFWEVLTKRLVNKYEVLPVHTLSEIELLYSRFPENIKLFRVIDSSGATLGGVVMYIMKNVVHTQYTGTTDEGRRIGVLDYLYAYLIKERFSSFEYLDFGISTEQDGRVLNEGLIAQKEGFGGRGVVYDTYEICL